LVGRLLCGGLLLRRGLLGGNLLIGRWWRRGRNLLGVDG
jgi:hypothetical protein